MDEASTLGSPRNDRSHSMRNSFSSGDRMLLLDFFVWRLTLTFLVQGLGFIGLIK